MKIFIGIIGFFILFIITSIYTALSASYNKVFDWNGAAEDEKICFIKYKDFKKLFQETEKEEDWRDAEIIFGSGAIGFIPYNGTQRTYYKFTSFIGYVRFLCEHGYTDEEEE